MAKRAKRKASKKKSKQAKKRKPAKRTAKKAKRAKKPSTKRAAKRRSSGTARSNGPRKIPSEPSGQNELKAPAPSLPRELAQAAPDARFDDPRKPESTAREQPDGSAPPLERVTQYKNTDEPF